ncbi:MAG: hypothetical protein JWQ25_2854 [Daejeonella sp.]|nr:hypothetical protein [Daejeonella sp.]
MTLNLVFSFLIFTIASCNLQRSGECEQSKKASTKSPYDQKLGSQLSAIFELDQAIRIQWMDSVNKYGIPFPQINAIRNKGRTSDSLNLISVKHILNTRGWLGPETVGETGSSALFLVIQHSDTKTMEHYLPMLREAVKNKKADSRDLAKMEDRVLVNQDKKQLYGTQIGRDSITQKYYVYPLNDPDNVDKRRAKMGFGKLSDYLLEWQIKWDLEKYKSQRNNTAIIHMFQCPKNKKRKQKKSVCALIFIK